ncbi:MAG TPA: cephalosporin hydroxylase family protein [Candidatus Ozemobacteraceae bacterium]|nr:cephalosporin hydroxylase family protein [Candidatus Ozemobacteraceae bacterium]
MDDHSHFLAERRQRVAEYPKNSSLQHASESFLVESIKNHYSYNFDWMGLPIIQYPQDLIALQEIIWETRPDCIIETGVARGGSLVFYASMLELLGGDGFVVGIDIDIRAHNRRRLMEHPLMRRLRLIDGSSVSTDIVQVVESLLSDRKRVMVCLDSNHTHDHVFQELQKYAPLVTPGCYCVVFDTIVEDMPAGFFTDRPWDKGNNPRTAVSAYLQHLQTTSPIDRHGCAVQFVVDHAIDARLLVSAARGGWLRRRPRD